MQRDGIDLSSFGDIDTLLLKGNPIQNTQHEGTSTQRHIDEKYFRMLKMVRAPFRLTEISTPPVN